MKKAYPVEFVYQALSLIVVIIIVHAAYVLVIRPRADAVLAQRQADLAVNLLRAGAVTPFELDLIIPAGQVDHFAVLAQGLSAE